MVPGVVIGCRASKRRPIQQAVSRIGFAVHFYYTLYHDFKTVPIQPAALLTMTIFVQADTGPGNACTEPRLSVVLYVVSAGAVVNRVAAARPDHLRPQSTAKSRTQPTTCAGVAGGYGRARAGAQPQQRVQAQQQRRGAHRRQRRGVRGVQPRHGRSAGESVISAAVPGSDCQHSDLDSDPVNHSTSGPDLGPALDSTPRICAPRCVTQPLIRRAASHHLC